MLEVSLKELGACVDAPGNTNETLLHRKGLQHAQVVHVLVHQALQRGLNELLVAHGDAHDRDAVRVHWYVDFLGFLLDRSQFFVAVALANQQLRLGWLQLRTSFTKKALCQLVNAVEQSHAVPREPGVVGVRHRLCDAGMRVVVWLVVFDDGTR